MSRCDQILQKARNLNIDECEVVQINKKIITVRIINSEIGELKKNMQHGTAVRLIHEKKIFGASANNIEKTDLIERAMKSTKFMQPKEFWKSFPGPAPFKKIEKTYDKKLDQLSEHETIDIASQLIESSMDERISDISGSLNVVTEDFEISNTEGLTCSDRSTYITGTINTDSNHGINLVSGIGSMSCRTLESFSADKVGKESREMCLGSMNSKTCEPDTYSIIFEPYAIGDMLAFVFSPNFGLKSYSEKKSCFSGQFGKNIATEEFSLMDDPHLPDGIGTKAFDDEGIPTVPQYLIDSGCFSSTYSDLFSAFKLNSSSTGNAIRSGPPVGRMATAIPDIAPHNLVVKKGQVSEDEMIQDTKRGLIVGRLWYTYLLNPERGDFSCTARSGVKVIQNGRIVCSGKPFRIVHNLPFFLRNISAIGKNPKHVVSWSAIPCASPSIRVEKIRTLPIQ